MVHIQIASLNKQVLSKDQQYLVVLSPAKVNVGPISGAFLPAEACLFPAYRRTQSSRDAVPIFGTRDLYTTPD
ncbi:hypothetical protein B0537_15760 [Desulforamulus ferrireducens]|uniref:Uncharacterized protein n=1 Tax=Desulforamulus ferrireducens TaxID=1833852 RepID=A0A1S6J044_9FIRM|nr:hypothetical protein B0537_15760 [Desulforamulus ferrireducens]